MPSTETIAGAVGSASVNRYWPTILAALRAEGIDSEAAQIAAAATLRAEVGTDFAPIAERYPASADPYQYFEGKYGPQTAVGKKLGNVTPGDGYKFRGRGFIQLTGRGNYTQYGRRIGTDLVSDPDAALTPYNAARIFAAYFKDRGVVSAAEVGDWPNVRRLVNGGLNGWTEFKEVVDRLLSSPAPSGVPSVPTVPTSFKASGIVAVLAGGFLLALLAARRG